MGGYARSHVPSMGMPGPMSLLGSGPMSLLEVGMPGVGPVGVDMCRGAGIVQGVGMSRVGMSRVGYVQGWVCIPTS